MSDKEEDSDSVAGEKDDLDEEPSTSWGGGKRSGLKRKLMVESDEEEHRMAGSGDEDSDDEDATGDLLEDEAESGDSDSSGTPGAETCAICLGKMRGLVGSPAACEHTFCLDCILEWAKNNPTCPQDRIAFDKVLVRKSLGGPIDQEIPVSKEKEEALFIPEENPTYCEVCNCCDREERLLLCDGCDLGYHLECLDPPLTHVPIEEWFCPVCVDAGLPSVVANRQQNTNEVRVQRHRSGRSRSQSTSRHPRLIPRTGATERIRARIQHNRNKKRLKRKKRRERKRARIASGEIEDKRPAVKTLSRFSVFEEENNDIDAEFANDERADMLLSGFSDQSARRPEERKANAARLLRDAAFTPQPFYSGRSSSSIMSRIRDQPETQEDDILSGILENQSIVFSSSRNLTLNSERKLTKQSGDEDNSFILKEESLIPEPLPSRRASSPRPDIDKPSGSTDERSFSSFRSSQRHRPHSPPPRRRSCSPYRSHRTRSPLRRANEGSRPLDEHRSPLDSRRRSPQISYQRQLPRQNTWERRHNGSSSRKDYNGRKDRWSEAQEDPKYQRQNSPHQRKSDRERNSKEVSNSSQGDFKSHGNRENQPCVSHSQGRSSQDPDFVPSRESHQRRDDSPDRRRSRYSHRDHSPHRRNRSWEKDSHFHRRKYSPSKRSWSRDERDRGPIPHRSFASDRRRSRSRSRSRERESRHPSLEGKDRKSRSQWSYSYFNDVSGGVSSSDYSVHSLHGLKKSPGPNGREKDSGATSSCEAVTANTEVCSRSSNADSKMERNLEFENKTITNDSEEAKLTSECLTQDVKKIDKMPCDKEENIERKRQDTHTKSYKNSSANVKKSESCDISNDYSSEKTMKPDMTDKEEEKGKRHKNIKDNCTVHHDEGGDGAEHSKKKKAKLINSLFGEDDSERQHQASSPMNTEKISQKGENKDKDKKSSKSKIKKQSADVDITNKNLFGEDSEEDTEIPHHRMQASKDILQSKMKKDTFKDVKVSKQNSSTNKNANVKNGMKETEVCNGNNGRHLKGVDLFGECDHEEILKKQDKQKSEGFIIKKKSNDTVTGQNDKEKELKERFMAGLAKGLFGKSAPIDESEELHGFYAPLESKKVEKSLASHEAKGMFKVIEKNVAIEKQETDLNKHGSSDHKPSTKASEPNKFKKDEKHVKKGSVKEAPKLLKKDPKLVSSLFGSISDIDSSSDLEGVDTSSREAFVDRIVKHFGKSPESGNIKHEREKAHHKHSKHLADDGSAKRDQKKEKDTAKEKQEDSRKYKDENHKAQEKETSKKDEKMEGSKTATSSSGKVTSPFTSNRKENDVKLKKVEGSKFATPGQQASSSNTNKKENDSRIKQQKAALEVKVVKEVKKFLDPYYRDKTVSKDEYKEIVAKCVNKVVSAECGDIIETEKMRSLVEGYVKFYKHRKTKMQLVSS